MPHRIIGIICTSPGWGGLELNTIRLAAWLREEGWKVHLLTAHGTPIAHKTGEQASSVTTFGEGNLPGKAGQLRAIHAWVRRYKIHALLVPYNKDIAVASLYKRFYDGDIGLVYQQHMQVGVKKRDLIHSLRYAMLDVWISPLQYLKTETLRMTRVPEDKIEVVPFGIEPEKFVHSTWTRETARRELGLPEDAYIIGLLGRLDPKKGQDLVIRALSRLQSKGNYELLLMGAGTLNEGGDAYSRQLRELVETSGLSSKVHFKPYTDDIMAFFRAIDVFAMPSHGETFGMVTIESMAARVPVLGTNRDGTREILGEGRFGYLFEKEDMEDFLRQLDILRNDATIDHMLQSAQDHVFEHYSRKRMVGDVIRILEEVINPNEGMKE